MKPYKRNLFQRILGICATQPPQNGHCWSYANGQIVVDLSRAPELERPGSGMRLEGRGCPERVLIIYGDDCRFHAFRNRCAHAGRRLDPVPGAEKIQCCSVNKTSYDYQGRILAGPAKEPVAAYPVELKDGKLTISIA